MKILLIEHLPKKLEWIGLVSTATSDSGKMVYGGQNHDLLKFPLLCSMVRVIKEDHNSKNMF